MVTNGFGGVVDLRPARKGVLYETVSMWRRLDAGHNGRGTPSGGRALPIKAYDRSAATLGLMRRGW